MSELSARLRLRREELGLSQEQLAQRMGYRSKSSITKLEKGINDIPQSKLEELAAALAFRLAMRPRSPRRSLRTYARYSGSSTVHGLPSRTNDTSTPRTSSKGTSRS